MLLACFSHFRHQTFRPRPFDKVERFIAFVKVNLMHMVSSYLVHNELDRVHGFIVDRLMVKEVRACCFINLSFHLLCFRIRAFDLVAFDQVTCLKIRVLNLSTKMKGCCCFTSILFWNLPTLPKGFHCFIYMFWFEPSDLVERFTCLEN